MVTRQLCWLRNKLVLQKSNFSTSCICLFFVSIAMLWNGRSFQEGLGGVPITHHQDSSVASKTGLLTHTRPLPPPPPSPPLHTHAAYHQTPCHLTHGFTGVSLCLNHWHSTPVWIACFLLSLFSHTFLYNFLQRSLFYSFYTVGFPNSFPFSDNWLAIQGLLRQSFSWFSPQSLCLTMPIISAKGWTNGWGGSGTRDN